MLRAFGWVVLRASPPHGVEAPGDEGADRRAEEADRRLADEFRRWMAGHDWPFLDWHLVDDNNNDRGVLTLSISRNHTAPELDEMLVWITANGPGSYGLLYLHDDEDDGAHRRETGVDRSNVFRAIRVQEGAVTELDDPFFGPIFPTIEG